MTLSNIAGYPRIGRRREIKFATEGYWAGNSSESDLLETGRKIRLENWRFMQKAGIDLIPSNDFSFYDQMLDTVALVGAVPPRYKHHGGQVDLDTYFAMARGRQSDNIDVIAMEMTKWFDTNYHYLVPEVGPETRFVLSSKKVFDEYQEAAEAGVETVPVLIGPLSFLLLAKPSDGQSRPIDLLEDLVGVYEEVIARLGELGASWVQIDEPCLVQDREPEELEAFQSSYERLLSVAGRPKILLKTYFDHVGEAYPVITALPFDGVGLDFVRGPENEELIRKHGGLADKTLFAGVIDGRNVWINNLESTFDLVDRLSGSATKVVVSTSSSLLHLPIDLDDEPDLDSEVRSWIAFAAQKVDEVVTIAGGRSAAVKKIEENKSAIEKRLTSTRTRNPEVRSRIDELTEADARRPSDFETRRGQQRQELALPLYPTTTIGSFPQTDQIRLARSRFQKKEITADEYRQAMKLEIEHVIRFQEDAGIDVLVHGEPERNDMVQYFAEQLEGFVFTGNAWVQSYGSRYVRPPILFGDVHRPKPMTLEWIEYAQSLTDRPVKGMLTGPVTMLMWSFVRDDQPRSETCTQVALAVRDEVADLEVSGARIIQVDEPALREGVPLRHERWQEYLDWAVRCFRLATSGVRDETQIQTHLCYSELGDIIEAVDALDADVNLMWSARAGMRLVDALRDQGYRNEVGPGVYDIHSPRVPSVEEMVSEIRLAVERLDPEKIWVNPDCGLKTRQWKEVEPSLKNMVEAARSVRAAH